MEKFYDSLGLVFYKKKIIFINSIQEEVFNLLHYPKMSVERFDSILDKVKDKLERNSINFRKVISAE